MEGADESSEPKRPAPIGSIRGTNIVPILPSAKMFMVLAAAACHTFTMK